MKNFIEINKKKIEIQSLINYMNRIKINTSPEDMDIIANRIINLKCEQISIVFNPNSSYDIDSYIEERQKVEQNIKILSSFLEQEKKKLSNLSKQINGFNVHKDKIVGKLIKSYTDMLQK